jgi:NADH-quinone oxidoreductase subunit A
MSGFLHDYVLVALVASLPILLVGLALLAGRVIRPTRPSSSKAMPYESGADPAEGGWGQSHLRYYIYALLFVVFDVEIAFIVPWAVQVEDLGGFGLVEMLVFVVILALGLAYAWRKGVLTWDS